MNKIIKGDQVIVIAGKDKGKQGTILAVKVFGIFFMNTSFSFIQYHIRT